MKQETKNYLYARIVNIYFIMFLITLGYMINIWWYMEKLTEMACDDSFGFSTFLLVVAMLIIIINRFWDESTYEVLEKLNSDSRE